jgi:hypothetical protein
MKNKIRDILNKKRNELKEKKVKYRGEDMNYVDYLRIYNEIIPREEYANKKSGITYFGGAIPAYIFKEREIKEQRKNRGEIMSKFKDTDYFLTDEYFKTPVDLFDDYVRCKTYGDIRKLFTKSSKYFKKYEYNLNQKDFKNLELPGSGSKSSQDNTKYDYENYQLFKFK